ERFADEPRGFAHALITRPAQESVTPVISDAVAAAGEQLWEARWKSLERLPRHAQPASELAGLLRLTPRTDFNLAFVHAACSKALDDWGVQMQRLGKASRASVWFQRALLLNPENLAARLNLDFNEACRRGDKS